MLCLAILVQCRVVTDRRTHDDNIYRDSIASHSKNHENAHWQNQYAGSIVKKMAVSIIVSWRSSSRSRGRAACGSIRANPTGKRSLGVQPTEV